MIPPPKLEEHSRKLAKALPVDILVDPDTWGKVFCYIDDLITIDLFKESWQRLAYTVAIIIDIFARLVHKDQLIKRDHLLSMKKLYTEGSFEEVKTILG